jgi:hypothetical protein
MLLIIIIFALIFSAWLCYEMHSAPFLKEEKDIDDDPTTTFWHEKD